MFVYHNPPPEGICDVLTTLISYKGLVLVLVLDHFADRYLIFDGCGGILFYLFIFFLSG